MAVKKTFSYLARNARRAADRAITNLERLARTTKNKYAAQGARQKIENIKAIKQRTYINNAEGKRIVGRSNEERTEALEALKEITKSSKFASARGRRNLASTQKQLNLASVGLPSIYTKAEVKIFYRATQNAWQREGVDFHYRNQAILEYYGYESLSELVSDVLVMNQRALEASKLSYEEALTKEQQETADEETDIREAKQYPQYLREVISMPEPSGLNELPKA